MRLTSLFYIPRPCSHMKLYIEYDFNYMKGTRMSYLLWHACVRAHVTVCVCVCVCDGVMYSQVKDCYLVYLMEQLHNEEKKTLILFTQTCRYGYLDIICTVTIQ